MKYKTKINMGKFANTLFLLLACLFTVQGMRAETSTYDFTNGFNSNWYTGATAIISEDYVSFSVDGNMVLQSEFNFNTTVKRVVVNVKAEGTGLTATSAYITLGGDTAYISSDYADVVLEPVNFSLNEQKMELKFVNDSESQITINLKSITVVSGQPATISYAAETVDKAFGDTPFINELANTGDGTVSYASSDAAVATVDAATGEVTLVAPGETTITATVADGETNIYATNTASYTLTVAVGTMTVTATDYSGSYDGAAHGITVTAPEGAAVKYGTAEGTYDLEASPAYTDAGTYTVYYQATKTNYTTVTGSAAITIAKAAASISYATTSIEKTYGEESFTNELTKSGDGTVTYASSAPAVATVDENGVVTIVGVGNADITATVADGANYTYAEATASYTLHVVAQSMTVTATGYSGTYDGAAHGITVTAPEGAAVKYGVAEGTYDLEASPAYTDAGTYTVYYQATKTNYTTVTGSAAVTIAKAAASISYATASIEKTYGEESFTNELTKSGDGTVTYASSAPAVATVDTATGQVSIVDAGETTITATVADGANYAYATNTASYTLIVVRNNVVEPVVNDSTQADMTYETSFSENTEVQTTQLTNALIDNVLYTLNDQQTTGANDDGYDETRGVLVINSVVTSDEMEKVVEMQPGTKEFAEAYKGLTLMVPPGYGHLEIASYQESGYSLCVKIGQDDPVVLSHAEMRNDTIPFAVSQSAYVYIYLMQTGEGNKSTTRGPKTHVSTGLNRMMIIADDIERVPLDLGYDRFLKRDHVKMVETRAASYCTVSDNGVNRIEEDLFGSLLSDKTNVMYIDLRSTSITGLTVDRSKGDFKGVPENTIIYLPAGNSSDEPNVVIGSVCKDLRLSNNGAEFMLPMDFMAVKATYQHNVGSGEVSTLYVPFNIDEPDTDGVFYELGGVENDSVAMTVVDKLKAHTPYAFRAGEEKTYNLTADYAKLERAADSQTSGIMRGTYETVTADASGCYYGLTGDTKYMFKQLNNGDVIAPFSAYLYIENGLPQYGISWSDHWGEDVPPSGIKDVAADETDAAWYTLSGQKLSRKPTAKGLYIHQGKIIMNK